MVTRRVMAIKPSRDLLKPRAELVYGRYLFIPDSFTTLLSHTL
jgi:hypothetical protein